VTQFLSKHPGGQKVLLKVAGTDASKQFDQFHNAAILQQYSSLKIGSIIQTVKEEEQPPLAGLQQGESFGDLVPFGDPYWYQDWSSPYYDESHRKVRAAIRQFVEKEIMPHCHEWDEAKQIPKELFKKAADAGILAGMVGNSFPTKYAGNIKPPGGIKAEEFDAFHEYIICDEIARCGSGGVLWGLSAGLGIGLPPIIHFGSEELKNRIIPPCIQGKKFICLAVTEPSGNLLNINIQLVLM
jgi:alkylation response protein AidB-like acyl-CoA dehydrogenase